MVKALILIVASLALIQLGSALQCYNCNRENCKVELTKQPTVTCGQNTGNGIAACLKYTVKDKQTKEMVTQRKCVITDKDNNGKATYNCKQTEGEVVACEVCTTDLCNSAPVFGYSFVTFASVIMACLIPKYLL